MGFSEYLLCEGIEPKKPLGKLTKKKITKNRGMINQRNLDQVEFVTSSGNNVKVQFSIEDSVGDVVFYVNNTLDDLGGRADGSVDPEILSGVLWVVDVYSDRMKLNGLTFSAWAGKGDTKVVRGLDLEKPQEAALNGLREYLKAVSGYKASIIPPTPIRLALAAKLGRTAPDLYDVNVGKLQMILGEMIADVEDRNVARTYDWEEEVLKTVDNKRLEDRIPGSVELLELLKKYNVARMSHSEGGASVTRNRRQDLYKRLMDKFFSGKWNIEQKGNAFTLARKGIVSERVSRKFSDFQLQ